MPPALRRWIFNNELQAAGEALASPLTFARGLGAQPPRLHAGTLGGAVAGEWGWAVDDVMDPEWPYTPWPHDVLVTVEEAATTATAVFEKARQTARAGRRAFVLVATARKWKELRKEGGAGRLYLPHSPAGIRP